jgi:hypothetical protein
MRQLSTTGQRVVDDVAQRHRFSSGTVSSMLDSIADGHGSMAQFNHPEFGGSGQWMRGGMIMLSDMFDNNLKSRIDGLCNELSNLLANEPGLLSGGSFQSQSQGDRRGDNRGGGRQYQDASGPAGPVSLFVPTGAQNDVRYAYFGPSRRLALDLNGKVTVYDTLDHRISGFSQQQSIGGSLTFSSQHGLVDVAGLPVVAADGEQRRPAAAPQPAPAPAAASSPPRQPAAAAPPPGSEVDILATIEKLAELHRKGILSDAEFAGKKTELLGRL